MRLAEYQYRSTRLYLKRLAARHAGDVPAMAKDSDVNRTALYRLLKRHHVDPAIYRTEWKRGTPKLRPWPERDHRTRELSELLRSINGKPGDPRGGDMRPDNGEGAT